MFKKELLKYIRPEPNSTYNVNDTKGLKLLKITDIETTTHFPLHCPNHHCARKTLFHKINQVSGTILRQSDSTITKILLFGDNKLDFETSKILLMSTIEFINRDIQLSLIRVKPNDLTVSLYSHTNETFMF